MPMGREQNTARIGVSLAQAAFERLGFIFREQFVHDFGIDAHVELVEDGSPTGSLFAVQVKSGASYFSEEVAGSFVFRINDEHLKYWTHHSLPVVLLLSNTDSSEVYWQLISDGAVVSTGLGWKLLVPKSQTVNGASLESFRQLATRVVPVHRYTVLRQEDVSWGGAKRYSLDILLNGSLTKAEIASVLRQAVLQHVGSSYYRDSIVEEHWGDSDAHVIFLFVYPTLDDRRTANWICRSLWIDESLPDSQAPPRLKGESIGLSIITEWSDRYQEMAAFWQKRTLVKEDYLRAVTAILNELRPLVERIAGALDRESDARHAPLCAESADEVLRASEPLISRLYSDTTRLGLAPVECRDVNIKLQSLVASAHNLVLPFCDFAMDKRRNRYLEKMAIGMYKRDLPHLEYELEKVR